jgi:hypothetical protein
LWQPAIGASATRDTLNWPVGGSSLEELDGARAELLDDDTGVGESDELDDGIEDEDEEEEDNGADDDDDAPAFAPEDACGLGVSEVLELLPGVDGDGALVSAGVFPPVPEFAAFSAGAGGGVVGPVPATSGSSVTGAGCAAWHEHRRGAQAAWAGYDG